MGASVVGYTRNITDDLIGNQPGFYNDCKAWGNWMAERESHPDVLKALHQLGLDALLSHITDGVPEEKVKWVSPDALAAAANRLRELVLAQDASVVSIVKSYALSANGVEPVHEEFAQDLADVTQIAEFFKENGVKEMTLEVNW